jgi:cytochrome c oxidase assembly factor CtaG
MRALAVVLACLVSSQAWAHAGHLHWLEFGATWTWDAWTVVPLTASIVLYCIGLVRLWRRAGAGRGVRVWQAACFAAAWLLLVAALIAPLHWLGGRLFAAHMIEHELLMVLAAPLLVVARPIGAMLWAMPAVWRRGVGGMAQATPLAVLWRWLTEPLVATIVHGVALWAWHIPAFYEAALTSDRLHWLQHLSFFATALLFWWSLLRGRARERGYGAAVIYLFATSLHTGFLGILLSLARQPLYPAQTRTALEWGLTPLEDQQLAGLIMWVPAGLVYAAAALALAGLWIARSSAAARRGSAHALAG